MAVLRERDVHPGVSATGEAAAAGAVYTLLGTQTGEVDLASAPLRLLGEQAGDYAGYRLAAGDLDDDGRSDWVISATGYATTVDNTGAVYVLFGGAVSGDYPLSGADVVLIEDDPGSSTGECVAVADMKGDGAEDLVLSAPNADVSGVNDGATYVLFGPLDGTSSVASPDAQWSGAAALDNAGGAFAPGDFNGDGVGDLLIGAQGVDTGGASAGAAFIVLGPPSGMMTLAAADAVYTGGAAGDALGGAASTGDMDGDGLSDALFSAAGASSEDRSGAYRGAVYLMLHPGDGDRAVADADATLWGTDDNDMVGRSLATGRVDADAYDDLLVGAPRHNSGWGSAYLVLGPLVGSFDLLGADATYDGAESGEGVGWAVAIGDVDDDDLGDLLLGAYSSNRGSSLGGAAYLIYGLSR